MAGTTKIGQAAVTRWRSRRLAVQLGALGVAVITATVACSSGGSGSGSSGSSSNKPALLSKSASGTLAEWNWDIPGDDPGESAVIPILIKAFEKQYPHMHVVNTSMSLADQNDKLPLAFASGSSAPVVSETNEGLQNQGRLVADNELIPLESYNKLYGWFSKVGPLPLQFNSLPATGKTFGSGNVYGVPETGTVVGIFYNRALLASVGGTPPTDWATFTSDLAKLAKAGKTAMSYAAGQPTAYQPVHTLYTIADHYVSAAAQNAFVFHTGTNQSIDTAGFVQAAATFAAWTKDGYFPAGYQSLSDVQALNLFDQGKAGFFLEGDWYSAPVEKALGSKAGFWVPPVVTGGPGEGWSIPSKSPNPNAGAALINTLLSPPIQDALLKYGDIPAVTPSAQALAGASPVLRAAAAGWSTSVHSGNLVPYLDYATPNFLNQEMAGIQELQAGKISASALMQSLQSDYTQYWSSQG
ncbi:MAG TPA: extracellular solute-binding protein [Streptosporangiaceae bacterium]|nr:extracellular solute-binding protein [Streptosporangiaceae bacterium]